MLTLVPTGVSANPDVWVKAASVWHVDSAGMEAITFEWRFDEYFSSRSIEVYDRNRNGDLEPAEVARLQAEAFEPLARYDYFVHAWVDGEPLSEFTVQDFSARIDGAHLLYRFKLALPAAVSATEGPLVVSLHDPRTVVDFQFIAERFLLVEGTLDPRCKFRIKRSRGALAGHAQPVTLACGG